MNSWFKFNRTLILLFSLGYLTLAFEIYLQHFERLEEIKIMWTPIVFGIVGGILGLIIYFLFNKFSYYLFMLIMTVSLVVGSMGLFLHNRWRVPLIIKSLIDGESINIEFLAVNPPMLAPSAFIAMGVLGILIAMNHPWGLKKEPGL